MYKAKPNGGRLGFPLVKPGCAVGAAKIAARPSISTEDPMFCVNGAMHTLKTGPD